MRGGPGRGGGTFLHLLGTGIASLIALAVLVALVVVIVKLAKGWRPKGQLPGWAPSTPAGAPVAADPTDSALTILSERLAKGEIEVDDYYARRTALHGPDPHRPQPEAPRTEG